MGRYHAPSSLDTALTSSKPSTKRKRPLSSSTGVPAGQTVRFEMPYAMWCGHCPQPTIIPQGVRFNALKTRDGSYYTTPIWRFSIKHSICGGEVVIRTDPKNTEYEVVSGGRRRDYGDETAAATTVGERDELRKDAFRKLEKTIADEEIKKGAAERIDALQDAVDRDTWDPYARNQALRKAFRVGRKERERQAERDDELRDRLGTGVELLEESEEDRLRAGIVDFEGVKQEDALSKPLFGQDKVISNKAPHGGKEKPLLKGEREAKRNKDGFVSSVMGNTRIMKDPFLTGEKTTRKGSARLAGVKRRKQESDEPRNEAAAKPETLEKAPTTSGLVDYDSD